MFVCKPYPGSQFRQYVMLHYLLLFFIGSQVHSSMEQFSMKNAKYLHLLGKDIRVTIEIALTHRIALVQKNHGLLLWNRVGDAICGMPQSLAQSTCTKIGSAEVTWHCGQSPDDHSLQCQGECQTVSLRGNPILYTEIRKMHSLHIVLCRNCTENYRFLGET